MSRFCCGSVLGDADRIHHQLRPSHLIAVEHHAVAETGAYESFDVAIHFLDGIASNQPGNVNINVRVGLQEWQHVINQARCLDMTQIALHTFRQSLSSFGIVHNG